MSIPYFKISNVGQILCMQAKLITDKIGAY